MIGCNISPPPTPAVVAAQPHNNNEGIGAVLKQPQRYIEESAGRPDFLVVNAGAHEMGIEKFHNGGLPTDYFDKVRANSR